MPFHWRLRRKNEHFTAIELRKLFPELKILSTEQVEEKLISSNLEFYEMEKVKTSIWMRLTLPLVCIISLILLLWMPCKFIITGKWGYKIEWFSNWIRSINK